MRRRRCKWVSVKWWMGARSRRYGWIRRRLRDRLSTYRGLRAVRAWDRTWNLPAPPSGSPDPSGRADPDRAILSAGGPLAETIAPLRGTYRFVLRKVAPHPPEVAERVSGYDEAQETYDITHPDGIRRRTLFLTSEFFRDRLWRMGSWEDVTEVWFAHLDANPPPPKVLERQKAAAGGAPRQGRAPIKVEG